MNEVKLTFKDRIVRCKNAIKESGFSDWARLIAYIIPIAHMILSTVHVRALLKLEDQICGFFMFMSILFGLVVLFEATRARKDKPESQFAMVLFLIIVMLFIVHLVSIYKTAILYQSTLQAPELVWKAIYLSYTMLAFYGLSLILMILSFVFRKK